MVKIVEAHSASELEALGADWRVLQETCASPNVFQSYEWVSLWWKHFGGEKELRVFLAVRDGAPVLAVPLFIERMRTAGIPIRRISVIGNGLSSDLGFLSAGNTGDILEECLEGLCQREKGWGILAIKKLPHESETLAALRRTGEKPGFAFLEIPANPYPYIAVEGSFDSYLRTKLSKRLRKTLRNRQNRLKNAGNVRFLHEGDMDPGTSFDELLCLAEKGWKHRIGKDPLTPARHRAFFRDLAGRLRDSGMLSLSAIELDGEKIAFDLSFLMRGTFFAYYTIFNESLPDLSPGKMMVAHMIEHAFERGVTEINLSEGEEEHKLDWTDACRQYREAYLLNTRSPMFIPLLSSLLVRKGVKRSPLLRKGVEKAKARLRRR